MDCFEQNVRETINKYSMLSPGDCVIAGLSGGADSVSLVYTLNKLKYNVIAVHINHMIRGEEAQRDMNFVSELCSKLGIPLLVYTKDIPDIAKKLGISEELAGRKIRYECFEETLKKYNASAIAVAHNMNDSLETMIFNMVRGSGMAGLSGIPPVNGNIIRPLINIERREIESYLRANNIGYVCDSTNSENTYSRNIIRNLIVPHFEKINTSYVKNAKRCADLVREENLYLNKKADEYIDNNCIVRNNEAVIKIPDESEMVIFKRVLMKCLSDFLPDSFQLSEKNILDIVNLSTGKTINFSKNIFAVRKYDNIIIGCKKTESVDYDYDITSFDDLYIRETDDIITFQIITKSDDIDFDEKNVSYIDFDKTGKLTVRNRRAGDMFIPFGMNKRKKLKEFFIDSKIDTDIRKTVPILCSDGEISAIIGVRTDENYKIDKNTVNILKITRRTKNAN